MMTNCSPPIILDSEPESGVSFFVSWWRYQFVINFLWKRFDKWQKVWFTLGVANATTQHERGSRMATTATPKLVGKALYLELVADPTMDSDKIRSLVGWYGDKAVKQVIIFPQYQDDTGKIYEPYVMSRIVSPHSPKAQWDKDDLNDRRLKPAEPTDPNSYRKDYVDYKTYSKAEWDELTDREKHESRVRALDLVLRNKILSVTYEGEGDERVEVVGQGWVVRDDKPFSVEITDQDIREVYKEWKTPQAVIRRINKVRGTLDKFPESLA